jgi:hypothetical protein
MTGHDHSRTGRKPGFFRRRFGILGVFALTVLGAYLGISFTADTGTTSVSVSAGSTSKLVFTQQSDLPTTQNITFRVSFIKDAVTANDRTPTAPNWTPVAGTAGAVTTKGDLALIDARSSSAGNATQETVTIYITNLKALQATYSSFAFPIRLYQGQFDDNGTPGTIGDDTMQWATSGTLIESEYLTNTSGYVSFRIPTAGNDVAGNVVAVQLGQDGTVSPDTTTGDGGAFYTVCTDTVTTCPSGTLDPTFYITVQPS